MDAGTELLSYLCSLGLFSDFEVENGHLEGLTKTDFFGIAIGTEVRVDVDDLNKTSFHMTYRIEKRVQGGDEEDDDDYYWWEEEEVGSLDFNFCLRDAIRIDGCG
jgi:hypothetical protein